MRKVSPLRRMVLRYVYCFATWAYGAVQPAFMFVFRHLGVRDGPIFVLHLFFIYFLYATIYKFITSQ